MGEHLPRGLGLGIGELARKPGVELDPVDALVDQLQPYIEAIEQLLQRREAAARKHEEPTLLLEAPDHAWRARR